MDELVYLAGICLEDQPRQWGTLHCKLFEANLIIMLVLLVGEHVFPDDVAQRHTIMTQDCR